MNFKPQSIRTFIGAKNYTASKDFYRDLGFQEVSISSDMCFFKINGNLGFYLQDYYVKDWVNNSMVFLEVDNVESCLNNFTSKKLDKKYEKVRFTEIKVMDWGKEFFMHDPSGVLWHFGTFNK